MMLPPDPQPRPADDETPRPLEELFPLVYEELRSLARGQLRRHRRGVTIQTTALVHDAWLKMGGQKEGHEISRPHFMALAATAMRHLLAHHAERRATAKRGGDWRKVTLNQHLASDDGDSGVDLVVVSETLEQLWKLNATHGRLAELRLLADLGMRECAEVMGVSLTTVEREWRIARAWLGTRLGLS